MNEHTRNPLRDSSGRAQSRSSRSSAWIACRTSGAPPAASAPRSIASRGRWWNRRPTSTRWRSCRGSAAPGRVAGYARLDSFHTTHGRAIPFATGLKLANPELQVVVYSGDGDLFAIGGNHFIHAARRNMDLKVICVNNLTYAMTGGQTAPTTPGQTISATSPYGVFEPSFNLVQLAEAAGAAYVARWTTFHVKQLARSMAEILKKKGFCFIEVLSPCPTLYQRRNKMGDGLDAMKFYKEVSKSRQRRTHRRSGAHQGWRDHGGQICGSRPPRLLRAAETLR